jgi:methionine biosynthesis protein MetW
MIRNIYRRLVPVQWRQSLWNLRWLWAALATDYEPKSLFLSDYDQYWKDRVNKLQGVDLSYRELIDLCASEVPSGGRVLDFGCGAGDLLLELSKRLKIDAVGVDVSEIAVILARQQGVNAQRFCLNGPDDLKALGHFDIAIATEVLEHIPQAELVLVALSCVADRVLISIPNTGFLNYRLRLLAGRFPHQWIVHPAEHVRFWTLADFRHTVQTLGLQIVRVNGVAGGRLGRWYPSLFAPDLFFVLSPSAAHHSP